MSEITNFLKSTLSEFNQSFLYQFSNETVYSIIEYNSPHLNLSYLSEILCNDKGYFVPNSTRICQCDLVYFGQYCRINGVKYWGQGWIAFRILFGLSYGILSLATWYYYIRKLLGEGNCSKMLFRLIGVPKYLIIENLILISNTRFLFILIDPFAQNGVLNYQSSRVLYELIYGSLVGFYLSILIIWVGVYTSFKMDLNPLTKLIKKGDNRRQCCTCSYQRLKIISIILLLIIFPIQILFSYYVCDRGKLNDDINSIIYIIVFVVLVVIGFTLYYTITLKSTLNKTYRSNAYADQIEVKVLYNYGNDSDDRKTIKGSTVQALTDKDLIDFLDEMYQKKYIELVENCIINRTKDKDDNGSNRDEDDDVLDRLDIEKEKKHFDDIELLEIYTKKNTEYFLHQKKDSVREISENDPFQKPIQDNSANNKKLSQRNAKADKSSIELMELTETDMKNLDLVFQTSYFILTSTLIVFVLVTMVGFNIHTDKPSFVIGVIVSQFVFELCGFFAIFYLFVRDIKTQEYENLKSLAEIENFHKRKEESQERGLLYFKGISLTEVWARFQSYITLHRKDQDDNYNME